MAGPAGTPADWKKRYATFYGGIGVNFADDGRVIHRLRQSTIGDLDLCPERGRRVMTGTMPADESDAASVGTAIHAGIEDALLDIKEGRTPHADTAVQVALGMWEDLQAHPDFRVVKFKRKGTAEQFIETAVRLWFQQILPSMDPIDIELRFGPLVLHEDDERVIEVTGTIDLLDRNWGTTDWKTSSDERRYRKGMGGQAWEKERWAIQPTTYLWAAYQLDLLDTTLDSWPFTYVVFARGSRGVVELQQLTVHRHRGDFEWLRQKSLAIAHLIEAKLPVWPKNDTHALCSPIWCPAWDTCKGREYTLDWPKPSAPADHHRQENN